MSGDSLKDQGSVMKTTPAKMDTPASVVKAGKRGSMKPPSFNKDARGVFMDPGTNYAAVRVRANVPGLGPTPSLRAVKGTDGVRGDDYPQRNQPGGKNLKPNKRYPLKDVR